MLSLSPSLVVWVWCRCSIQRDDSSVFNEPPDAEPHVRWCGRTAGVTPPPTRCAPGRAHLLGGESPLLARQGEELAERQGCRGRLRIWRKPKAKRWPDEQEADKRRHGGVRRQLSSKPETCTGRRDVYPTGISAKVGASYPGRSAWVPSCYRYRKVPGGSCRSQQRP